MIAELFAKKYPESGIQSGNQIDGKELCGLDKTNCSKKEYKRSQIVNKEKT